MNYGNGGTPLETKFASFDSETGLKGTCEISGYASIFGAADQGGDVVVAGAYGRSLEQLAAGGRSVKMLWQHDPATPIGVWDEVREDAKGLWVKGRILVDVQAGAEALVLITAKAIDGLSIGYRTIIAEKDNKNQRLLHEIDIWEVSLVTFPMLPEAKVETDFDSDALLANELLAGISAAREEMLA